MKQLPLPARVYVATVIAIGAALLAICLPSATFAQRNLFLAFVAISSLSAALKVTLPLASSVSTMSVSYALDFASLLLIGPHETMLVAAASAFSQCQLNSKERNPAYRTLFSMASLIITVEAAGFAFSRLQSPGADPVTAFAKPLVGAATTYFLVNTGLVAVAVSLATRQPIAATWQKNFLWSAPSYFVGAGAAAIAAWALRHAGFWVAPLTFAPIYLTYRTYRIYMGRLEAQRHVQETSDLHLATIEALASAIDATDRTTNAHIRRLRFYAGALAEAIELSPLDTQAVKTAALLHDIGKLAVPEHILSKPGRLSPEEAQRMKIHPQVGAEIIAGVPFPSPVAPLILSHHEQWDGKGYPEGLAGNAIPIGARILAVVDYYDDITTERAQKKALSRGNSIKLLQHEAGRSLDPTLVETFISLLPTLVPEGDAALPVTTTWPTPLDSPDGSDGAPTAEHARASAFENIGLAHREIYALYEIAQSMGTSLGVSDTMALISSKLAKVIPWSGCALFLEQPGSDELRCRYAAGVDAPHLFDRTMKIGEGLSGWVAKNRRTEVNSDPRIEFEAAGVATDLRVREAIVCPLSPEGHFIGSLALFHTVAHCYTDTHRRLIASVAEQAGAVIRNAMAFERAQEDSLTDPLTSLPNRRLLLTRLTQELARADRLRTELALIVLDLDQFKHINDTYGHHVGDEALRQVADALRQMLRGYDLCVRFAGDEFVVVITDAGTDIAEAKRRELEACIAAIDVDAYDGHRIRLSASAGAAIFPRDGTSYEQLLSEADRRMYQNKAERRLLQPSRSPDDGDDGWEPDVEDDELTSVTARRGGDQPAAPR